jgi:hypothetical protein
VAAVLIIGALLFGALIFLAVNHGKLPGMSKGEESSTQVIRTSEPEDKSDVGKYKYTAKYPHDPAPKSAPKLRLFFIGDTYTMTNNLPKLVEAIAATDQASPVNVETAMFAMGVATLGELYDEGSGRNMVRARGWDYVVLQDDSLLPMTIAGAGQMYTAMEKWSKDIRHGGGKIIVLETWARKPGSEWFTNTKKYGNLKLGTPESMQDKIDTATNGIAYDIGAAIVPAGDYWQACAAMQGMPDLYSGDGHHPSLAGDYLTALLFYRAITGHKLSAITYVPEGLKPEDAGALIRCASYG